MLLNSNEATHFLWGAATSPHQVEGELENNDWYVFANSKSIKERLSNISKPSIFYKATTQVFLEPTNKAVKFWDAKYYEHDFDLAQNLGLNAFRIGLEWSRIEPEKNCWNEEAINGYKKMILSMRKRSLEPIVALNHTTLPIWILSPPIEFKKRIGQNLLPSPLKDVPLADPLPTDPYWKSLRGWENHETIERFINFVSKIIPELKDQVDYWITITEPVTSIIGGGYIAGIWSPGFVLDGKRAKTALHNLIEAHVQAYNKITHLDDEDANGDGISKTVGFTQMMLPAIPAKSSKLFTWNENRNIEATNNFSYFVNDYFLNAVVNGEEDVNYLNTLQRYNKDSKEFIIHEEWKNKVDFIGLDYYRRVHVYYSRIIALSSAKFLGGAIISDLSINNSQSHGILNDLGWEIYPHGLYHMIMKIKKQWIKPVFVTENGVADRSDRYRAPFIIAHLQQIRQAIDEGADIVGYLHWSFTDNYEWQEGYRPEGKFGLFTIDFSSTDGRCNLDRDMTIGAEAFKFIIQESMMENNSGILTTSVLQKAKDKFGTFSSDGTRILR